MKAYSGILQTRGYAPNDDEAYLYFDEWSDGPVERNSRVSGSPNIGRMGDSVQVGGDGDFNGSPAHLVHIREVRIEDSRRGSGRAEIDNWTINSYVTPEHLYIRWLTPEKRSKVDEIGILVIGE